MKFKYKALLVMIVLTIGVFSLQCAMQFISSYKFIGFVKKDQSTWIGIAETAQADYQNCSEDLEALRKVRNSDNSDILKIK